MACTSKAGQAIRRRGADAVHAERAAREESSAEAGMGSIPERVEAARLEDEDRKRLAEVERVALGVRAQPHPGKLLDLPRPRMRHTVFSCAAATGRRTIIPGLCGLVYSWRAGDRRARPAGEPRRDPTHLE